MIARSLLVTVLVLPLLLAGCRKAKVESYRIPKEKDAEMPLAAASTTASSNPGPGTSAPPTAPVAGSMSGTPVATAEGAALTWSVPPEWKAKPGSPMRKGSYAVPGIGGADGDLAVTAFPGDVGGELANVNRWRNQIQLPPVSDADLPTQVQRLEHDGLKFGIVDMVGSGQSSTRILGAYVPFAGATWFFKLTGPDAVVTAAKPAFLKFLETVKPAAPSP